MAVKKAKETKVEEVVEVTEVLEVEEVVTETEEEMVEETIEVTEVEVAEVIEEVKPTVEVDTKSAQESERAEGKVKIRMRVDHKCCIAMERYDLKAGKTYTVPENVKGILNRAGLLAPL